MLVHKLILATLVLPFFHISPLANANSNPNWAQGYIGELRFDLNDDQRLREFNQSTSFAAERLKEVSNQLGQKTEVIAKLRSDLKMTTAEIDKVSRVTVDSLQKKNQLTTQKNEVASKIPELQNKLTLAQGAKESQETKVSDIKTRLGESEASLRTAEAECAATPSPNCEKKVSTIKERIENQKNNLEKAQEILKLAQTELQEAKTKVQNHQRRFQELGERIAEIDTQNSERAKQVTKLEKEQATIKNRIEISANEARSLEVEQRKRQNDFNIQEQTRQVYRNQLIERVLDVNRVGARYGVVHGQNDGHSLAQNIGINQGNRDGEQDGLRDGTRDGMNRDYGLGFRQGDIDGHQRALTMGENNGREQGTTQGNKDAAEIEGAKAGSERARNSDAQARGEASAVVAGLHRADQEGKLVGEAKGESEAIKFHESKALQNTTTSGEFAGAFSRVVPTIANATIGPSYRDASNDYGRQIVRMAYTAGYQAEYRRNIRMEFERNIAPIYDNAYDASYRYFYEASYNSSYDQERNRGHAEGENRAFDRDFRGIFDHFFGEYRTQFATTPDRESVSYRNTFSKIEGETFSRQYENIRSNAYAATEAQTFSNNIAGKTEAYRMSRFEGVDSLYKNNAVLKFVSSQMVDGGTNGIAAKDGVVMPGETLFYNITLKNFGDTAAHNVKVSQGNSTFTIPSIPGKSSVMIKGAAKAVAKKSSIGEKEKILLTLKSKLQTSDRVESRHFQSSVQELVATTENEHTLAYPFTLSNLKVSSTPILGQSVELSLSIQNKSKRAHSGNIEIVLNDDAPESIIAKPFKNISKIDSTLTVSDAKLGSESERNAYRPLKISAKLVQNGVTIGTLDNSLQTMIKARYTEKAGKPVIVVNSDSSSRELLNILAEIGGMAQASVLDTSLKSLNSATLAKEFKSKALIVASGGSVESAISTLLFKSQNCVLLTVDGTKRAVDALSKTTPFVNTHHYQANFSGVGSVTVLSAGKLLNKNLKGNLLVIDGQLSQLGVLLNLSEILKLSDEALLAKIATAITPKNFFAMSSRELSLLQVTNARMFNEILTANSAYKADKVESKHIREDKSTLLYKFAKLVDTSSKPTSKNVGLFMSALDSHETLEAMVNKSSIGKPVHMNVNAYIFGSPLVWNYATESMNKSNKALDKYENKLGDRVRNVSRRTSPIVLDRL